MSEEKFIEILQKCYFRDRDAFNEIVDIFKEKKQENQKYKEVIDKAILELANIDGNLSNSQLSDRICNLIDILSEVE